MLEFTCKNEGAKKTPVKLGVLPPKRSIGKTHELEVKREGSILHVFFLQNQFHLFDSDRR